MEEVSMIMLLIGICVIAALILVVFLLLRIYKRYSNNLTSYPEIIVSILLLVVLVIFITSVSIITSYNYLSQKGALLLSQNQNDVAIKPLKKALYIRSKFNFLAKYLDSEIFGFPLLFYPEITIRMAIANNYFQLRDFDNAIAEYQKIILIDRNNFEATSGIAESYFKLHDIDKSKLFYRKLISIVPEEENFSYFFNMGKAHIVLKDCNNAIEYFNEALKYGENNEVVSRFIDECNRQVKRKNK